VPPWLAHVATFIPSRCFASLTPAEQQNQPLLCAFTPRAALTIEAPLFISTNLFDAWLVGVEEECCGPFGGASKVGPDAASDPHFKYLMEVTAPSVTATVHAATSNTSSAVTHTHALSGGRGRGAFVPACIDHPMAWYGKKAPALSHNESEATCNQAEAVASWFFEGGKDYAGTDRGQTVSVGSP
jgi:hypothetical protein